ncbi:MAG: hypothetical protein J0I67_05570, partial [Bosea sp.]|nr:hypothetical protein [Bosea sp. (in: a-proteobacteria)]
MSGFATILSSPYLEQFASGLVLTLLMTVAFVASGKFIKDKPEAAERFEVIVADGQSDDATARIVNDVSRAHPNVR